MGDLSARSALTTHRGTANRSAQSRLMLVQGVDAPDACNGEKHDLQIIGSFFDQLLHAVRRHLACQVVDALECITQAHTIEGLMAAMRGE